MKVQVNDYYTGQLTKNDFFNVSKWESTEYDDYETFVNITFENVSSIEKLGDGLRIVFSANESHYFDQSDYSTITIF